MVVEEEAAAEGVAATVEAMAEQEVMKVDQEATEAAVTEAERQHNSTKPS